MAATNTPNYNTTYTELKPYLDEFYDDTHPKDLDKSNQSRYLSWEYCYEEFQKTRNDLNDSSENSNDQTATILSDERIDILALHLGFYLASWGMMRGSSFLLNMDYKIHTEIVKFLYKNQDYNILWTLNNKLLDKPLGDTEIENLANNLIEIYKKLSESMAKHYKVTDKGLKPQKPTNHDLDGSITTTLLTKILMGTMGCTPAYDRFMVYALKTYGFNSNLNEKSIKQQIQFYENNKEDIDKWINSHKPYNNIKSPRASNIKYPVMKVIDMAFWDYGLKCSLFEKYINLKLKENNLGKYTIDNLTISRKTKTFKFRIKISDKLTKGKPQQPFISALMETISYEKMDESDQTYSIWKEDTLKTTIIIKTLKKEIQKLTEGIRKSKEQQKQ